MFRETIYQFLETNNIIPEKPRGCEKTKKQKRKKEKKASKGLAATMSSC